MPRTDLTVTVAGIQLEPAFALGSWIAFKEMHSGSIAAAAQVAGGLRAALDLVGH